jgi:hypothetical protein
MLSLCRPEHVRANVALLSAALGGDRSDGSNAGGDYFALLERVQPYPGAPRGAGAIHIEIEHDAPWARALLAHFLVHFDVPRGPAHEHGEALAIRAKLGCAIDEIGRYHDGASETLRLLVSGVLVIKTPSFGSLADALGTVMVGPGADWPVAEYAELLWHEVVHQALFLEDMINPLFSAEPAELSAPEALVDNPILATRRPYHLAFHGAAVAAALHELCAWQGERDRARQLGAALAASVDSLRAKPQYLTANGRSVLDEWHAIVQASPWLRENPVQRDPRRRQSLAALPTSLRFL